MTADLIAQPAPGTIIDIGGRPCGQAFKRHYPLRAQCLHCQTTIRLGYGRGDWYHSATKQARCPIEPKRRITK